MTSQEVKQLKFTAPIVLHFKERNRQLGVRFVCSTDPNTVLIAVFKKEWESLSKEKKLHDLRPIEKFRLFVTNEEIQQINT